MNYAEWIATQSVAAQEKAFGGKGKARLFRNLLKKHPPQTALAKFVSSDGSEVTLKDLLAKYGAPETR